MHKIFALKAFYTFKFALLVLLSTLAQNTLKAQRKTITETVSSNGTISFDTPTKKSVYNVAVLSPMFLDSTEWTKNLAKLPKHMMAGLDFYQGIRIAADTLNNMGHHLKLFVFDSKAAYFNAQSLIETDKLDSMDLIIGNASVADLKLLAEFAKRKRINFISAVSPSDADQTANPYFTILQPTLSSHIEKLHKHISRNYPEDNVVFAHRASASEKNALNYFKNDVLNPLPGRFMELELKDKDIDIKSLIKGKDTMYNTTVVLGVLDPQACYNQLKALAPYAERYRLKVYCMPTAEAIKSLSKTDEFPGMPIFYSAAYIIDKVTPASQYISRQYKRVMGGTATDVVYKGFESLYFFANLMKRYGVPFNEKMGDNSSTFITPYKIVQVKDKGTIKYNENKFLYLIRYEDGIMTYE